MRPRRAPPHRLEASTRRTHRGRKAAASPQHVPTQREDQLWVEAIRLGGSRQKSNLWSGTHHEGIATATGTALFANVRGAVVRSLFDLSVGNMIELKYCESALSGRSHERLSHAFRDPSRIGHGVFLCRLSFPNERDGTPGRARRTRQ